jgi:hypothetical protein
MISRSRKASFLIASAVLSVTSCEKDPTDVMDPCVTGFTIFHADQFTAGGVVQLDLEAKAFSGEPCSGELNWISTNPRVASVIATGSYKARVTTHVAGIAVIISSLKSEPRQRAFVVATVRDLLAADRS